MTPGVPVLADGMVRLDALTLSDAEAHWAGEDEAQARRLGWYPLRSTLDGVRAHILASEAEWRLGGPRRTWAVREPGNRLLLGGCELRLQGEGNAEMSWWVFPSYRRRGIASRAVRVGTAYAFSNLGVHQINARIEPDNLASRGVAHNAGFVELDEVWQGRTLFLRHMLVACAGGSTGL